MVRELRASGVSTGAVQRGDPALRLIGSIVLDCTALRLAPGTSENQPRGSPLGRALDPRDPVPVVVTWDEDMGWCVGLHEDPVNASRRYLQPDLLPAARAVADFVGGLALGHTLGAERPFLSGRARPTRLSLVRVSRTT